MNSVTAEDMIAYLQFLIDEWMENKERFGADDRIVRSDMHAMIACKGMVENLIGMPVNLQKDGKVTVGF